MPPLRDKVYVILISVVTFMWAGSVAISFVSYFTGGSYKPDPFVHAAFMIIVGALFGLKSKNGNGSNKNGDTKKSGDE